MILAVWWRQWTKLELVTYISETFHLEPHEIKEIGAHYNREKANGIEDHQIWTSIAKKRVISLSEQWFTQLETIKLSSLCPTPGMLTLIEKLKSQYIVGMLSNIQEYQAKIVRPLGYYQHFSPLLLSYELGVEKPDPSIYQILIDRLALAPEEILFIDDKIENVEGAKVLGIDALFFSDTDHLREDLRKRDISIS